MQIRSSKQPLDRLPPPERWLAQQDLVLATLIVSGSARWPSLPKENPIWGLVRIVMAQQISTNLACQLAERAKSLYPEWATPQSLSAPSSDSLRKIGLSQRRAQCCADVLRLSGEILERVEHGHSWEEALAGIKGIGPWTLSIFRIMVLREPDVLPLGDVGLERAVTNAYGESLDVLKLSEQWRPFRSIACWYLWRTLGNAQLG